MMSWPRSKPTYLYMLVLESSWAHGSGQESAHCCSTHCSALSCWALVRLSGTWWRAPCPVQISTSSKWPVTSWLAQSGPGNASPQMWKVFTTLVQIKGKAHFVVKHKIRNATLLLFVSLIVLLLALKPWIQKDILWQWCPVNKLELYCSNVLTECTLCWALCLSCASCPPQLTRPLCSFHLFTHSYTHTCSVVHTHSHGWRQARKGLSPKPHIQTTDRFTPTRPHSHTSIWRSTTDLVL